MWTDSQTVLKYLRNSRDRFNIFVANRITFIKENTSVQEWRYVNSSLNPADDASRALQSRIWLEGPQFLLTGEEHWPEEPTTNEIQISLEVKNSTLNLLVHQPRNPLAEMIERYSSWLSLRRAVGWLIVFKGWVMNGRICNRGLTTEVLESASEVILKHEQRRYFGEDIICLLNKGRVKKSSSLVKLDATLVDGMLRLGGRLSRSADMSRDSKHPLILSGGSRVTELLVRSAHERLGHLGYATVTSELRQNYWIVRGARTIKRVLRKCVTCKKLKGPKLQQKMADLPVERVDACTSPFTNTGLDCFEPFIIKH